MTNDEFIKKIRNIELEESRPGVLIVDRVSHERVEGGTPGTKKQITTRTDISDCRLQIIYRPDYRYKYLLIAKNDTTEYVLRDFEGEDDMYKFLARLALSANSGEPVLCQVVHDR